MKFGGHYDYRILCSVTDQKGKARSDLYRRMKDLKEKKIDRL